MPDHSVKSQGSISLSGEEQRGELFAHLEQEIVRGRFLTLFSWGLDLAGEEQLKEGSILQAWSRS